jgi:hypothetical protein
MTTERAIRQPPSPDWPRHHVNDRNGGGLGPVEANSETVREVIFLTRRAAR